MKDILKELESRAKAVEKSVVWWESKLTETLDQYESATGKDDKEKMDELTLEIKTLLRRAEMEKVEMAKIESEINEACANAAFNGDFSESRRKKNDG
tara:strand:- start:11125 stop:11415 length:291 start_codon:yes stop_codon:yes gene_type:complete